MAKIKIDKLKCKGCGLCVLYCPHNLITISDVLNKRGIKTAVSKKNEKCTGCTFCALVCPDLAIKVYK